MTTKTPSVGVCSFGRIQSRRCPNKMLRPFAGTTLTDIVLDKLARCGAPAFFSGEDAAFRRKAEEHGVAFVQRDRRSVTIDEPIVEILSFLRAVDFDHLLIVNACLPFLRLETIQAFLRDCVRHDHQPAFGVVKRTNHFMRLDRQAVNFDPAAKTINTKTVEPLYEFAHALYFFNRHEFFACGAYWDWRTVRLVEMPSGLDTLDIDTEDDFQTVERLWRALGGQQACEPLTSRSS